MYLIIVKLCKSISLARMDILGLSEIKVYTLNHFSSLSQYEWVNTVPSSGFHCNLKHWIYFMLLSVLISVFVRRMNYSSTVMPVPLVIDFYVWCGDDNQNRTLCKKKREEDHSDGNVKDVRKMWIPGARKGDSINQFPLHHLSWQLNKPSHQK